MSSSEHAGSNAAPTVLLASLYPDRIASTRLRLSVLENPLKLSGYEVRTWSFLADGEIDAWLHGGFQRIGPTLRGILRCVNFFRKSRNAGLVIVQRELVPFNSLILEKSLTRMNISFVWDLDDGLWQSSSFFRNRIRGTERKYEWLARNAVEIWAGNNSIRDWVNQYVQQVLWVPTFVASRQTKPDDRIHRDRDLLAWIGTPSTAPFIQDLINELASDLTGWRLLIVGAEVKAPVGVNIENLPWTPENEEYALSRAWLGLYPLDTQHPATKFKSSLKSLLFRSAGVPVLVTPTPSTLDTMRHEEGGLFVSNSTEWGEALARFRDIGFHDAQVERASDSFRPFSADHWVPLLVGRIDQIFRGKR